MPSPNLLDFLAQKGAVCVPGNSPSPYVQGSPSKVTRSYENSAGLRWEVDQINRVVGYGPLREMLQPKHPYFDDKKAWVRSFLEYRQDEQSQHKLLYPEIWDPSRQNPYRQRQLSRSHTGRVVNRLMNLRKRYFWGGLSLQCLVTTSPREVSEYIMSQPNGKEMAWRLHSRFWKEYVKLPGNDGLACFSNLHTWKTENPLNPHVHFHDLIPNVRRVANFDLLDDDGEPTYDFVAQEWYKLNDFVEIPYSPGQLRLVKELWHRTVASFAKKKGIRWKEYRWDNKTRKSEPNINVYVDFVKVNSDGGRAYLVHKFNYQNRHPLEDYCVFSNENPTCPNPPAWLEGYKNRARVLGWWGILGNLTCGMVDEKEKISPLTAEPMIHEGRISLVGLMMDVPEDGRDGRLGAMDMVKGKPVLYEFGCDDVAWLNSVCLSHQAGYAGAADLRLEVEQKLKGQNAQIFEFE